MGGVSQDYPEAVFWFGQAARSGVPEAMGMLAKCYFLGLGVEENIEKNKYYLVEAIKRGDKASIRLLSELMRDGGEPDYISDILKMLNE